MTDHRIDTLLSNLKFLSKKGKIRIPEASFNKVLKQENQLTVDELIMISDMTGYTINALLNHKLDQDYPEVRFLVMDCDGVLTKGEMTLTKNGDEIKSFNAKDGMGIKKAQRSGMRTGIISAGISTGLVERRAEMLGVENVYVGKEEKLRILEDWLRELNLDFKDVAYIGDDLTDIKILKKVAVAACPSDAVTEVKEAANLILRTKGGEGCVRELIDEYLVTK